MTTDIALTLLILMGAIVLFITERIRLDLTALLVLGALAITGLVTPAEALSGFSNPAVITVWAVFILSAGLSRTGVADVVGRQMMRVAGKGEVRLLIVIMITVGLLSAFMNNVGVAALLLPVVITIARTTGIPASRLLMPMSIGALLGGTTTLIGTPPNILASDALFAAGMEPFRFFSFTPVGLSLLLAGVLFMAIIGRHMLPTKSPMEALAGKGNGAAEARDIYELEDRLALITLPRGSGLAGKTVAETRIGRALGLTILGMARDSGKSLNVNAETILEDGDTLLALGKLDRLEALCASPVFKVANLNLTLELLVSPVIGLAELVIGAESPLVGQTLAQIGMRSNYGFNVLALQINGLFRRTNLRDMPLEPGTKLLIQGDREKLLAAADQEPFLGTLFPEPPDGALATRYGLQERLLAVRIPEGSFLDGQALNESDLADAFGLSVLAIANELSMDDEIGVAGSSLSLMPGPDTRLAAGDVVWLEGKPEDLAILRGLHNLEINRHLDMSKIELESRRISLVEAVLSPHSKFFGKTLRELHFREKYGLSVLAIWRNGHALRSDLGEMELKPGDAFLLYGPRERIMLLEGEPDFVVLTRDLPVAPRPERAPVAVIIMLGFILVVLMGWLNIAIAAVIAASLMVLSDALTMEDAYQAIEWRAVFLIACMLPLGIAMETSGTAQFLANGMVELVGEWGGLAVLAGLFLMTNIASQFMPSSVVTVLMAPIAITTAADLSLSPYALLMAVAIAASASFMSPVGHPANVLVMGPGGYRFSDFVKVGIPLTLVVLLVMLLVLPVFWPLYL
jgi:di/tricarboxylate transporter